MLMRTRPRHLALAITAALGWAATALPAQAALIESANVGGFRTFQDTTTGRVWADLNNGYTATNASLYASFDAYRQALVAAGFTYAGEGAVSALLNTLSLSAPGAWSAYESVMASGHGTGSNGNYLGGFYADAGLHRDVGAFDVDTQWWYAGAPDPYPSITLGGTVTLGLWAYIDSVPPPPPPAGVPEPATTALVALAAAVAAARRRPSRKLDCASRASA